MPERPYHHGNLRRELLDSALALFSERGSFDFTFRELARAAGVTHNAPYRHFSNRSELLAALREEGTALLVEAEHVALKTAGGDPEKAVRALGGAYVSFALAHPHHFRLLLVVPEERPPGASPPAESFILLEDALEACRRTGAARTDLSARELALAAWALVHGFSMLLVGGQLPATPASVKRLVQLGSRLFFEGVRPTRTMKAERKKGTLIRRGV